MESGDRADGAAFPPRAPTPECLSAVRAELAPGEDLLWIGAPEWSGRHRALWLMLPVGAVFAFVGFLMVLTGIGSCVGVPFLAGGVVLMLFPSRAKTALARSVYAVTDRRVTAMDQRPLGGRRINVYRAAQLQNIERIERHDGLGDLIFRRDIVGNYDGSQSIPRGMLSVRGYREAQRVIESVILDRPIASEGRP